MYYGALLGRVKKVPAIDTFLINPAPKTPVVKGYSENAIISRLNKYQAQRELENARNRKTKR